MGDRLRTGKPSRYVTSHPGQLSSAITPWVGAMSTSESWGVNGHTAWYTSPVSVVSQCKLVSGWGLRKQRSAPHHGPCGSGRTLLFLQLKDKTTSTIPAIHYSTRKYSGILIPEWILETELYHMASPIRTFHRVRCAAIISCGSCKCKYDNRLQRK